jgi:hypothetical protein
MSNSGWIARSMADSTRCDRSNPVKGRCRRRRRNLERLAESPRPSKARELASSLSEEGLDPVLASALARNWPSYNDARRFGHAKNKFG